MQRALESIGGQFNGGHVAPAPRVWPPFVAVVYVWFQFIQPFLKTAVLICYGFRAQITPVSDELLNESIEEAWGTFPPHSCRFMPTSKINVPLREVIFG